MNRHPQPPSRGTVSALPSHSEEPPREPWLFVLDEALRRNSLTIGGIMLPWSRQDEVIERWHQLKRHLGLNVQDELKYNLNGNRKVRKRLDEAGHTQAVRVPLMLEAIVEAGVTCIADTMVDLRDEAHPTDFYCYGLGWHLERFALHVKADLNRAPGPHQVWVDEPPTAKSLKNRDVSDRLTAMLRDRGRAAHDLYARRWREGETYSFGRRGTPLRDLDFSSSLHAGYARHCDLRQIADVVASSVNDFVDFNLSVDLPRRGYQDDNFEQIAHLFRAGPTGSILRYGFELFPDRIPNRSFVCSWADQCAQAATLTSAAS